MPDQPEDENDLTDEEIVRMWDDGVPVQVLTTSSTVRTISLTWPRRFHDTQRPDDA